HVWRRGNHARNSANEPGVGPLLHRVLPHRAEHAGPESGDEPQRGASRCADDYSASVGRASRGEGQWNRDFSRRSCGAGAVSLGPPSDGGRAGSILGGGRYTVSGESGEVEFGESLSAGDWGRARTTTSRPNRADKPGGCPLMRVACGAFV